MNDFVEMEEELKSLAIKHHAQDVFLDIPAMTKSEIYGALVRLRKIDQQADTTNG